jgi:hypothetical protein
VVDINILPSAKMREQEIMKRALLLGILAVIILAATCSADEITLKVGLFSGWKYSEDGENYSKVGMSASDLFLRMEGNDEATEHLKSYKSAKITGLVFGILGLGCSGAAGVIAGGCQYSSYYRCTGR